MKGYKVVCRQGDKLISYVARDKAQVTYRLNEWAKAPKWLAKMGYHLTFFKDLEFAQKFLEENSDEEIEKNGEIWRCEAKYVVEVLPPFCYPGDDDWRELIRWEVPWPEGTFMAKEIKLIKKVIPKEEK